MPKYEKKSKHLKLKASKTLNIHADENFSSSVNIGLSNVSKWNQLKKELYLKTDEAFVSHLLKTLENSLSSQTVIRTKTPSPEKPSEIKKASKNESSEKTVCNSVIEPPSSSSNRKSHRMKSILENKMDNNLNNGEGTNQSHDRNVKTAGVVPLENQNSFSSSDCVKETTVHSSSSHHDLSTEQTRITVLESDTMTINNKSPSQDQTSDRDQPPPLSSAAPENANDSSVETVSKTANIEDISSVKSNSPTKQKSPLDKSRGIKRKLFSNKTRRKKDSSSDCTLQSRTNMKSIDGGDSSMKPCPSCNLPHLGSSCSLFHPVRRIKDSISYEDWVKGDVFVHSNSVCDSGEELNFSKCSLPECLELKSIESSHDYSVIARLQIPQFIEFGPLIGQKIKMQDIPDDCNMRSIWEVQKIDGSLFYLSTENLNLSNWLAYIRPASSSETCNVTIVTRDSQLYFVTMATITTGSELLYWTDSIAKDWDDKKVNKKNCGGCNLKFDHNFYYRLHCQIFHDPKCSLTVRKYHCKVCGAAILGKQNIVKHAAELHKGKGAYQCPFCKKFFLRLNYLEMHKTYGCSANPQRSRPLCDFCGRKFCQPQKLKVHIKRMHGDISSILAEFQCMSCLRVLGSRAALQRHNKEVHHKSERESFVCHQCGKGFQNKSNLKIHMLTHSGIKPFRCSVGGECSAAFTTKQCLQLHYKKFHGLLEENMPPIRRMVEYTFNAYAGGNLSDSQVDSPQSCENSDSQCQTPASPLAQVTMPHNTRLTPVIDNTSHDNTNDSFNQNSDDIAYNTNNYDEFSDCINNSSVIMRGSKKWISKEIVEEVKDRHLVLPTSVDSGVEPEVESKLLYPYGRTDSSNASLLVEAAIDAVEKVINVGNPPLNFTITHDSAEISSGIEHEEPRRAINSPSPIHVPQFSLASHPESQSNSLDISISSPYQGEISPTTCSAPYSLHLSPVDVVNVAEQNEPYLRKNDDISGDESDNPVQNLCLSPKDRLHINILAYKPYSDNIEEKSNLLKPYDNRDRLLFLKHYSPLDDRNLKYDGLDDRLINVPEDRSNIFKQYELLDERSPTLLKQYDVMEERSSLYKLYDSVSEERGFNFEPLESMDMSRCSGIGHIYSNLQVSPLKYPRPLYGTSPSHSYSDVLRDVNLHPQSVDLSLSRPTTSSLIPSSPTYQSYPLSPTLPTYLTPRSALSPTYHPYSGYY